MKKLIATGVLFSTVLFLTFGTLATATVLAKDGKGSRSDDKFMGIMYKDDRNSVNFNLSNQIGSSATASANIGSKMKKDKLIDTSITLRVNGSPSANTVYEGWLADNETGYKLSLGALSGSNSKFSLNFRSTLVNLFLYDKLIITEETLGDTNPNPNRIVFSGDLPSGVFSVMMKADLRGSNEVPANNSVARGKGNFVVNVKDNTIRYDIRYTSLEAAETASHIHGFTTKGANAGVLFNLPTGSNKTGTLTYTESQEADILAGKTYVNVHSSKYPNGEIRGQIELK